MNKNYKSLDINFISMAGTQKEIIVSSGLYSGLALDKQGKLQIQTGTGCRLYKTIDGPLCSDSVLFQVKVPMHGPSEKNAQLVKEYVERSGREEASTKNKGKSARAWHSLAVSPASLPTCQTIRSAQHG